MVDSLTKSERKTIDDAINIILSKMPVGSSWQLYPAHYMGSGLSFSGTYFDSAGGQHSSIYGTPSEIIAKGISMETRAGRDAETLRLLRVKRLREELATLTGEIAA